MDSQKFSTASFASLVSTVPVRDVPLDPPVAPTFVILALHDVLFFRGISNRIITWTPRREDAAQLVNIAVAQTLQEIIEERGVACSILIDNHTEPLYPATYTAFERGAA